MTFNNATMLAGIAGAVVPLTLHLLGRARYRSVRWGAVMFLGDEHIRQSRVSRLKEFSLLLLRMAIVATLAIALARPVLNPSTGSTLNEPTSMVILIDCSPSMMVDENGPRCRDTASRAALAALATLQPGDEVAVLYTPQIPQRESTEFTTDFQAVAAQLGDFPLGVERADIAASLSGAVSTLRKAHAPNRKIVLVCDRQALSWQGVSASFAATWKQQIRDATGQTPQLTIIPVGNNDAGNIAVQSMQVLDAPIIRNIPTEVEVKVRNYDTVAAIGLPLSVSVGNRELYRTSLNLAAGASTTVRFSTEFPYTGPQLLNARINTAGPEFDDTFDVGVDVIEPISVLLICGDRPDTANGKFEADGGFAKLALMPFATANESATDPAWIKVANWEAWPELDRSQHQVVILSNVPYLTATQTRQLEQFVYGGGGLFIAPGNLSRVDQYNAQLWRDGAGVLPAELEPPVAADGSAATSLLGLELSHPIFQFLRGHDEPLPNITIGRYFPAQSSEFDAHIIGRYASGKPFLIEHTYGRGRILLMTTSLNADWSTLPLSNFYLPMLQSSVRYLAAGMQLQRNVLPGQPLIAHLDEPTEPRVVVLAPGANTPQPAEVLQVGDGYEARFTNTSRPGFYRMRIPGGRTFRGFFFLVGGQRDESDLSSLPKPQWTRVTQSLGFRESDPDPLAIASQIAGVRIRRELWPYLLPSVLLLLALELALTRFWVDAGGPAR